MISDDGAQTVLDIWMPIIVRDSRWCNSLHLIRGGIYESIMIYGANDMSDVEWLNAIHRIVSISAIKHDRQPDIILAMFTRPDAAIMTIEGLAPCGSSFDVAVPLAATHETTIRAGAGHKLPRELLPWIWEMYHNARAQVRAQTSKN